MVYRINLPSEVGYSVNLYFKHKWLIAGIMLIAILLPVFSSAASDVKPIKLMEGDVFLEDFFPSPYIERDNIIYAFGTKYFRVDDERLPVMHIYRSNDLGKSWILLRIGDSPYYDLYRALYLRDFYFRSDGAMLVNGFSPSITPGDYSDKQFFSRDGLKWQELSSYDLVPGLAWQENAIYKFNNGILKRSLNNGRNFELLLYDGVVDWLALDDHTCLVLTRNQEIKRIDMVFPSNGTPIIHITTLDDSIHPAKLEFIKGKDAGMLAAYDPASVGRVFISRDRGDNWQSVNSGAFFSRVVSLALGQDGLMAVATSSQGVMLSEDYGQSWTSLPLTADKVYLAEQGEKYVLFASTNDLSYRLEGQHRVVNATTSSPQQLSSSPPNTNQKPVQHNKASFTLQQSFYVLNDNQLNMDVAPYINKNSRVMIPLRFLAYALGLNDQDIKWDKPAQRLTLSNDTVTLNLRVADQVLNINGTNKLMDTTPEMQSDRLFLPARPVAEAFGWVASWDPSSQTLYLEK